MVVVTATLPYARSWGEWLVFAPVWGNLRPDLDPALRSRQCESDFALRIAEMAPSVEKNK